MDIYICFVQEFDIYIYIYNIVCVNKKYEFYKCTFIIKLHQILLHNNIVIFNYNMSNFKNIFNIKIMIHLIQLY